MDTGKIEARQVLRLENREHFSVGLVENVESFSDEEIVLKTALGGLLVCGSNLRLDDFSKEQEIVSVIGKIDKMEFTEIKEKHSFFKNMFK